MKFYNVTTTNKQFEIDEIIMNMSDSEVDSIQRLYDSISMVEYTNDSGHECMFVIIDNFYLSRLKDFLGKYSLSFKLFNLTKKVIFDEYFKIKFKNQFGRIIEDDVIKLIDEFKRNWVSKDDILDKILEKGIDSLTDLDLDILNS